MTAKKKGEEWIANHQKCSATVYFRGEGSYPFRVAPDIDYDITFMVSVIAKDTVRIEMVGIHNTFPNYEGLVDGANTYTYATPDAGPTLVNLNTPMSTGSVVTVVSADTPSWCCGE